MQLALVDDHILFRKALATCISHWSHYEVTMQAGNGTELIEIIQKKPPPQLVILDIKMPVMNGFETIHWLQQHYPHIKMLVVSMLGEEGCLEKLLHMGIHGFLQKDAEPEELKKALDQITMKGYYLQSSACIHYLQEKKRKPGKQETEAILAAMLSDRERAFLQWLCSDMSYKEIAAAMFVSPRTIDGYRDTLLKKIKVASRIGLVTFAIRQGIVEL